MLDKVYDNLKIDEKNNIKKEWIYAAEEYLKFFHPNGLLNSILKNKL